MAGIQRSLASQEYSTRQIVIGFTEHLSDNEDLYWHLGPRSRLTTRDRRDLRGNEEPASLSSPSFVLPSPGVKPCNADSPGREREII